MFKNVISPLASLLLNVRWGFFRFRVCFIRKQNYSTSSKLSKALTAFAKPYSMQMYALSVMYVACVLMPIEIVVNPPNFSESSSPLDQCASKVLEPSASALSNIFHLGKGYFLKFCQF